jgi:hypothetical protein
MIEFFQIMGFAYVNRLEFGEILHELYQSSNSTATHKEGFLLELCVVIVVFKIPLTSFIYCQSHKR